MATTKDTANDNRAAVGLALGTGKNMSKKQCHDACCGAEPYTASYPGLSWAYDPDTRFCRSTGGSVHGCSATCESCRIGCATTGRVSSPDGGVVATGIATSSSSLATLRPTPSASASRGAGQVRGTPATLVHGSVDTVTATTIMVDNSGTHGDTLPKTTTRTNTSTPKVDVDADTDASASDQDNGTSVGITIATVALVLALVVIVVVVATLRRDGSQGTPPFPHTHLNFPRHIFSFYEVISVPK